MQSGRRSGLSQSTLKTRLSLLFPPSPTAAAPKNAGEAINSSPRSAKHGQKRTRRRRQGLLLPLPGGGKMTHACSILHRW